MSNISDAELDLLMAEGNIRRLYGRYSDAVWRKDVAAFRDCYAEDAIWKIAGRTLRGRTEIGDFFAMTLVPSLRVMFWSSLQTLDLQGAMATGRTQVTELIKRNDGSARRTLAIYHDRFVRLQAGWRFQFHHYEMQYSGPPDLSGPYLECTDYGPPPAMPSADGPTPVP